MFPSDLWIADPNEGKLYKVENDTVVSSVTVEKEARAILVSQDMVSVYTVNRDSNTVSHFRDGEHIKDIMVEKTPYGICEDGSGNIYVTNYASNSISMIVNDEVVKTIKVSPGPRGICCDNTNTIWVASYLGSVVDKIVDGQKTVSIQVGLNPEGITCDSFDNIWTANYGSNTISKITRSVKMLDVEVGMGPIALVADSSGGIYVANYLDDTVTSVGNSGADDPVTIPVGDGPTAISVVKDDSVYVTSGLGNDVRKIVKRSVVSTIPVCSNPSAFGDFTGCSTYNVYNVPDGGEVSVGVPAGGWQLKDMSAAIKEAIGKVNQNRVETTASYVSYGDSSEGVSVQDALDELIAAVPDFKFDFFKVREANTVFETGYTLNSITVEWSFTNVVQSAVIKSGKTEIAQISLLNDDALVPAHGEQTLAVDITQTTELVMEITLNDDAQTVMTSDPVTIKFGDSYIYGSMDMVAPPTTGDLQAMTLSPVGESPMGKVFFVDCSAIHRPVVAVPADSNITSDLLTVGGNATNDWSEYKVTYTNLQGAPKQYNVYVFNQELHSDKVPVGVLSL